MKRLIYLSIWAIIQIALFVYLVFQPNYFNYIYPFMIFVGIILSITILSDDNKLTTSKLTWIVVILVIPILGTIIYLLFGYGHMGAYRKQVLENSKLVYRNKKTNKADYSKISERKQSLVEYLDHMKHGASYLHKGGSFTYYDHGKEKYAQMIKDIRNAKVYIHIEYFIIKEGMLLTQLIEELAKKVQDGVEVRIICDFAGSYALTNQTIGEMKEVGIEFEFFNRLGFKVISRFLNFRNHRKIVVIDGEIAYTGGFNIGDEYIDMSDYYGHWQDFHLRITNSSAIHEYETYFAQTWYYETNENLFKDKYYPDIIGGQTDPDAYIYPFVDGPDTRETYIRDMFIKSIMIAKKSIKITTPYFIPDSGLYDALIIQASSGVDVSIIVPGVPDNKPFVKLAGESYYSEMLKAGIKVFEYEGFIHSKKMLIDDDIAIIGTANFDMRSFNLSFEVCTLLLDGKIVKKINESFQIELNNSKLITLKQVKKYSIFRRISQRFLRLFAPLF
jgi:cardiolipin synthase A/B